MTAGRTAVLFPCVHEELSLTLPSGLAVSGCQLCTEAQLQTEPVLAELHDLQSSRPATP